MTIEAAVEDMVETHRVVTLALVKSLYPIRLGVLPDVKYIVRCQSGVLSEVVTTITIDNNQVDINFTVPGWTRRYVLFPHGPFDETLNIFGGEGRYPLDKIDEMRVLFNAVLEIKAKIRQDIIDF